MIGAARGAAAQAVLNGRANGIEVQTQGFADTIILARDCC